MEEILDLLRLVVYPIIYIVFYIAGWLAGFLNHQQYLQKCKVSIDSRILPKMVNLRISRNACNILDDAKTRTPKTDPLENDQMAGRKITVFNRRYIFIHGCLFHRHVGFRGEHMYHTNQLNVSKYGSPTDPMGKALSPL